MKEHYMGLGHVAIYTRDMEESIAFYGKLGGTVKDRGDVPTPEGEKKLALIDFGGVTLELIKALDPRLWARGTCLISPFWWMI